MADVTKQTERDALIAAAKTAFSTGFDGALSIAPDGMKPFLVDGMGETCRIVDEAPDNAQADGVWRSTPQTLLEVFSRKRALESSYLSGRLQIGGDMSIMARLVLKAT